MKEKYRKVKILFIQPMYKGKKYRSILNVAPLSLLVLSALTPKKDFEVTIVDEYKDKLDLNAKYDLVAITSSTFTINRAYELGDLFIKKGSKVILGGVHVTFMPDEAAKHANSVVIGECEEIWNDILRDFKYGKLKRKYFGGLTDLKKLPVLNESYFKKYLPSIQISRGCPNSCDYCTVSCLNGTKIRTRNIEDVIKEIRNISNKSAWRLIFIVDDNLFDNRQYAIELFKRMASLKVHFFAPISIKNALDEELLNYAYIAGCRFLFIGFESINPDCLKSVHKFNLINKYIEGIKKIKKRGIMIWGLFMFGFDYDTKQSIKETFEFAISNKIDIMVVSFLTPYPGTRLYQKMKMEKRIITNNWSEYDETSNIVIKLDNISKTELLNEVNKGYKKFYSIGSIFRRFNFDIKNIKLSRILGYFIINLFVKLNRYMISKKND
jgi:radical SAM superfamily enzyme YgiQ (UPF0313 family)